MSNQPNPDEVLGSVKATTEKRGIRLVCDAFASVRDLNKHQNQAVLVSVAGAESALRALAADLRANNTKVTFDVTGPGDMGGGQVHRFPGGYNCHVARLGGNTWHLLVLADSPHLLPSFDDESLWAYLREQYTTPLLRSWMPWLRSRIGAKYTKRVSQFGVSVAMVQMTNDQLDSLVSDGVRKGDLSMYQQEGE